MKNSTYLSTHKKGYIIGIIATFMCAHSLMLAAQPEEMISEMHHRMIVLSDIEAEVDDTESFVRLLLYSNEIDLKGLIATTSCWKKTSVAPEYIAKIIKAYGKVQPNLLKHDAGFPTADTLLSVVKKGLPKYGLLGVGDGKDSEGSDWIIKVLEEKDERPLYISVWGGANTLAQALYKIKHTKSAAEAKRLIAKLRVYTISDQDDSGIWIRNNFPDLFYIVSPGDDYGSATWLAINTVYKGTNNEVISNDWLAKNVQQGHGALGVEYPDVSYGMEGDTPSWLSLVLNGLNDPEHPDWGAWGGRYELYKPDFSKATKGSSGVPSEAETREIWTNAKDTYTPYISNAYGRTVKLDSITFSDDKVTLWRWREDFQNDFAARMDWCIKSFQEANHPPVAVLLEPEAFKVKSGQGFELDAIYSYDPDGDHISFLWFDYPEAGTYKKALKMDGARNSHKIYIVAPVVDKEVTIHIILKVTDKGTPPLSRYKRIIVEVLPK
ncbi:nucleoside hydrolase-like domain-containing protein [uncultured Bacteroides sp.]|uniref:nucleoside hydrolase-like domain-containing protein n=1 Tax=uncultured Bacteroides sp. TaxID=162156 RepID=UPI002AAC1CDA|nr:nucleoside hydrolase-like domain-containing protein [uncultured Bacteroides sp.]